MDMRICLKPILLVEFAAEGLVCCGTLEVIKAVIGKEFVYQGVFTSFTTSFTFSDAFGATTGFTFSKATSETFLLCMGDLPFVMHLICHESHNALPPLGIGIIAIDFV